MVNFHNVDCNDFMKTIPDKYYDLAIVDPPYGINAGKMTMGSGKHKFTKGKEWDKGIPTEEYFENLFRVSKNQIIWGGNYFKLPLNNNWVIWDKMNPNLSFSEAELAWCSINKNVRIYKYYSAIIKEQSGKIHPTQKPVDLYRWLLQRYATQGMKILDTHGGSMTHAIACDIEGFDLDICEIDKEYFDLGVKEYNKHKKQFVLFDNINIDPVQQSLF